MTHSRQRYVFIDLLRFIAVVFMIQGHTFDALLDFSLRSNTIFFAHDFFHGFIAPMFLFASGVAFGVSTMKKWEDHVVFSRRVSRRFAKFVGLMLIGYALHLPYFSLQKIINEATPAEIAQWLQVDVLHCIAVTMICLQLSIPVLKREQRFVLFAGILAAAVILASPFVWNANAVSVLPLWLASYVNAGNSSWFPLFPWSAYILCGVVFASFFLNAKEQYHAVNMMQQTVIIGIIALFAASLAVNLPTHLYPHHDVWKVNPLAIVARLGFVLVVVSALFFAEQRFTVTSRIPSIMGRESLFIYVLHLIIIYGSVVNKGLQHVILPTLSVTEALAVFALVFAAISAFTYGWHRLKKEYTKTAMATRIVLTSVFIYLFLTRPY